MATVKSLAATLLLGAFAGACALLPASPPSDRLIGDWSVVDIDQVGVTGNTALTVAFDETGRISGSAGCNRFTGAYSYDGVAGALTVTPLGVTRRMCAPPLMLQENRLVQSLHAATRVEAQADGAVALTSAAGRVLLRRHGAPAPRLTDAQPAPGSLPAAPDPLAPQAAVSSTALPPPSTSSYPLAGAPGASAPLSTPIPSRPAPMSPAASAPIAAKPAAVPAPFVAPGPATPTQSRTISASGEVYFEGAGALPADATVRVQLRDVSRAGAPVIVLGQQESPASGPPPFAFTVTAPTSVIAADARLVLFAQILSGNRLLYISDGSNHVPPGGADAPMRVRVVNAASAPSPARAAAPRPLPAPAPAPIAAPPVIAAPPLPALPGSAPYRCLNETFRLAFEDQAAFLTTADGAVARLARIDASDDPGSPRMFSNSILTVIKETESTGGGRVRFARGRMALTTCARVE